MRDPTFPDLVKYYADTTARGHNVSNVNGTTARGQNEPNMNGPAKPNINRVTRRHEKALLRRAGKKRRG